MSPFAMFRLLRKQSTAEEGRRYFVVTMIPCTYAGRRAMRARYAVAVALLLAFAPAAVAAQTLDPVATRGQWSAPPPPSDPSPGNGQRIAGIALLGVSAIGVVTGAIFGLQVSAKNREIDAICPTGEPCGSASIAAYNTAVAEAKIDRAASLVSFGVAAIFAGTGVALVLTAPKRSTSESALWLAPAAASSGPGVALGGTW